eukprot:TRINITY_DN11872_c0_g1_i1.p1 TRINITY_DN11872_c0_g1~~TRINITY_DN11872_c0_g1_i1.p1  ORF type:complete len:409 (-),score=94.64 TRINITY_DN11872_c0_g1_i1:14-1240(-)
MEGEDQKPNPNPLRVSVPTNLISHTLIIDKDYKLDEGVIEEADYCLAVPIHPDGSLRWTKHKVLLFCHGCRPEGIPKMADLDLWDDMYMTLLSSGWIVGMSSYRREGRIVNDAIQDITNLTGYLQRTYGQTQLVLLEGESMGGHISVLMAEQFHSSIDGVLAVGAALLSKKDAACYPFQYHTKVPLLFLTNETEIGPIQDYINKTIENGADVKPVQWTVARQGHCNVNAEERWKAFKSLLHWIKTGYIETSKCILLPPKEVPSSITFTNPENPASGGGWGKVKTYDSYGDIFLDFQEADLCALGIRPGKKLQIVVQHDAYTSKQYVGYYGTSGDSFDINVPADEWMIWLKASGFIVLCKNASLVGASSAALYARVSLGTPVFLKSLEPPRPAKLNINQFQNLLTKNNS